MEIARQPIAVCGVPPDQKKTMWRTGFLASRGLLESQEHRVTANARSSSHPKSQAVGRLNAGRFVQSVLPRVFILTYLINNFIPTHQRKRSDSGSNVGP
jgi:hypothetical protein